jgi:hypothetical protein
MATIDDLVNLTQETNSIIRNNLDEMRKFRAEMERFRRAWARHERKMVEFGREVDGNKKKLKPSGRKLRS